jgi:cytochrome P450
MADPLAFIPFGLGTRRCLGHRFALDVASLVLAMVVDEYQIEGGREGGGGEEEEEVQWTESSFNWYVKDGLFLKLTPRRRK